MAGEFDWTSLLGNIASGAVGSIGTNYVADKAADAATQSAAQAAQMAQFRPVGVTTRFGKSGFNYDPTGRLIGAGYQVAPDVAAAREGLIGMAGAGLGQAQQIQAFQPNVNTAAQGLFNLGQSYVGQNPADVAQQYMNQQRQLLAPGREQELAQLTNRQQQQGRLGLATGATLAGYTSNAPQAIPQQGGGGYGGMQPFMDSQQGAPLPNYGKGSPQVPKTEADWNQYLQMASFSPGANMEQIKADFMSGGNRGGYTGPVLGATTAAGSMQPQQQQPQGYGQQSQGLQATNPQMAAYYNAMAQQDAQLAANAQTFGNQQVQFGQGLMTGGLNLAGQGFGLQTQALAPYTQYVQGATNLENLGQNALTQGTALGSSAAAQNEQAAQLYQQGQNTANAAQRAALQGTVGGLTDPVSQLIASLTGGGNTGGVNYNAVINPYFQTNP